MLRKIQINILSDNFIIPRYSHDGDAGLDLFSIEDIALDPGDRKKVSCGFSIAIPEGYLGAVAPRSGLSIEHGVTVLNSWGVIDSTYRGEVSVILINLGKEKTILKRGSRIAQLIIIPFEKIELIIDKNNLGETERGNNGFGSTGN
jgi:dUTP pyrophosphatase